MSNHTIPSFLQQADASFKTAEVKSGFEPLPAGVYQVRVKDVQFGTTKSGKETFKWTLEVLSGEHKGRLAWHNNYFHNDACLSMLKGDLAKAAFQVSGLPDFWERFEELLGIMLETKIEPDGDFTRVRFLKRLEGNLDGAPGGAYLDEEVPF